MKRMLVMATVAVALAGCGGGSDSGSSTSDFKKDFAKLDVQLKATGLAVGRAFQTAKGKTDAQVARDFDRVSNQVGAINDKLGKLTAPDAVKDDYETLQTNLSAIEGDLSDVAADARNHDAAKAKKDAATRVRDAAKIKPVANRVRKAVGLKQSP